MQVDSPCTNRPNAACSLGPNECLDLPKQQMPLFLWFYSHDLLKQAILHKDFHSSLKHTITNQREIEKLLWTRLIYKIIFYYFREE